MAQQRTIYLAKPGSVNKLPKLVHSSNQYTHFTYSKNKKQVAHSRRVRVARTHSTWSHKGFHITLMMSLVFVSLFCVAIKNSSGTKAIASPLPTPIAKPLQVPVTPTPTVTISSDNPDVASYIREVFGRDADKAFELLQCENSSLSPNTVNTAGNYPEGSRDIGVFQINEYWQGVQGKFLFNYKVNVQIAKQLYDENDHTFSLWTCGKNLNI